MVALYFPHIFFVVCTVIFQVIRRDWLNSLLVSHKRRYVWLCFRFLLVLRHVYDRKIKMRLPS